jgi:hypothetical protein
MVFASTELIASTEFRACLDPRDILERKKYMREPPLRKTWAYSNITQPLS